jgi:folate-binding Fe-S cluster repair protein YgfZ
VKRRLIPVGFAGPAPAPGTPVLRGAQEVGTIRSSAGQRAMAVLRLDALGEGAVLMAGETALSPLPPSWMRLD